MPCRFFCMNEHDTAYYACMCVCIYRSIHVPFNSLLVSSLCVFLILFNLYRDALIPHHTPCIMRRLFLFGRAVENPGRAGGRPEEEAGRGTSSGQGLPYVRRPAADAGLCRCLGDCLGLGLSGICRRRRRGSGVRFVVVHFGHVHGLEERQQP